MKDGKTHSTHSQMLTEEAATTIAAPEHIPGPSGIQCTQKNDPLKLKEKEGLWMKRILLYNYNNCEYLT